VKIRDFFNCVTVEGAAAVESALAKRDERDANAFWLSHGEEKFPALFILVRGRLASLHYFPRDRHPGFRSCADDVQTSDQFTKFFINPGEEQPLLSQSVVSFETALAVAKEFLASSALPTNLRWLEL
jgi:hypothetical protein